MNTKITVQEAAKLLHVSDQFVRVGMQRGLLPIGLAMQITGKRWTYNVIGKRLAEYAGISARELERQLREIRGNEEDNHVDFTVYAPDRNRTRGRSGTYNTRSTYSGRGSY